MLRASFQLKLFLAAVSAAALSLAVAGAMFALSMGRQTSERIDRTLVSQARLAAALLEASPVPATAEALVDLTALDAAADRIGELIAASVTLVAPDGRVVGDSAEPLEALSAIENHAQRPEVIAARQGGLGRAQRFSDTLDSDMLYVAAAVRRPDVAVVRVALPLTDIREQRRSILEALATALGLALLGSALIAFLMTRRLGQRVRDIARAAERYDRGEFSRSGLEYGDDELGVVARALDHSVQEAAARMAELSRDRGRMAAILGGMIEGVILVDSQGRVQLANDAARQMLALGTLAIGRHYMETIRNPAVNDLVSTALSGATPESVQLSPPRDSSRTLMARTAPIEATAAAPRATPTAAQGAVLVLHDITDLRRADQVRRDFVANVSHELRTPLTAIRGYVEALSEGDTSREEGQRFLDIILRHTMRMERMVRDLLHLARLDAGQETIAAISCDARALIQSVVIDLTPSLEARQQRVEVVVDAGAAALHGDPSKLHDVLRNLIANASTYAPEGTPIGVRVGSGPAGVVIEVTDEGPGIPAGDLSRIFERFYRVDKSRARDPGGTGLGLAIVKHLVELHGGRVQAANRKAGGTVVTITLPDGVPDGVRPPMRPDST